MSYGPKCPPHPHLYSYFLLLHFPQPRNSLLAAFIVALTSYKLCLQTKHVCAAYQWPHLYQAKNIQKKLHLYFKIRNIYCNKMRKKILGRYFHTLTDTEYWQNKVKQPQWTIFFVYLHILNLIFYNFNGLFAKCKFLLYIL